MTKKQFPDCLPVLFAPAVGAVFLFASARLVAGSADVLIECSETASDERGIDACLSVVFEQAENRLLDVEQSWRKVLGDETTTLQAPVSQELVDQASDNPLSNDQPTTEQTDGPKVIAIVNDTALASGVGTGSGEIFNVDDSAEKTEALVNLSVDISARFEFIPALFRSYRDQHCAWQATVFGGDRVDMHYKACLTDQNRTRVSELNRSLAEIRSAAKGGLTMRGFYVKTNSGATFRACDRKIDWWVTGSETVLASLERRYVDANTRSVDASTGNFIYAELRGSVAVAPGDGPGADYASALQVEQINIFRPATPNDCVSVQQTSIASAAPQTDDLQSATVDDFAAAGFLYGYFNNWLSACSVTESSVCSAESEAQFASDGDWKLRVDRSLEGDWRVQLIPTINDELIEKNLQLMIDGSEIYLSNSFPEPMQLPLQQGVNIAVGEAARNLIALMRSGKETRFVWRDELDVLSELKFSLAGVTLALQFFDQSIP